MGHPAGRFWGRGFEGIAAVATGGLHIFEIPLIDGEQLAGLGTPAVIDQAVMRMVQNRTGIAQGAADSALLALAAAKRQLAAHIAGPEITEKEAADLAPDLARQHRFPQAAQNATDGDPGPPQERRMGWCLLGFGHENSLPPVYCVWPYPENVTTKGTKIDWRSFSHEIRNLCRSSAALPPINVTSA